MHRMMKFLNLTDVKLSPLDPNGYDTIVLAGETFRFPNGREAFLEQMSSYFPKEKDNLRRYLDLVARIASASTLNSLTSQERDLAANTNYQTRSINEVLEELFHDEMLRNARLTSEKIVEDARTKATEEADRIVENARESINYEKLKAMHDLKNQIATLSIDIAEKLMMAELSDKEKANAIILRELEEAHLN